ncbi:MAG: hypothetical protein HQK77_02905 [Desulfobacterales bacterium]|nr:hypothetical protein [Desulfobacterales bacterium]
MQFASSICVEISAGELIDKITILEIKCERITDTEKLVNVRRELEALEQAKVMSIHSTPELVDITAQLKSINLKLWLVEDELRDCEARQDFGDRFIELARSVYHLNDQRSGIKRKINDFLSSRIIEEKSYTNY